VAAGVINRQPAWITVRQSARLSAAADFSATRIGHEEAPKGVCCMGTGHRGNERQTSDHSVLISAHPHGLRQARIRDVSISGLFVELPPSAPLSNNTHVELIFMRSANHVSRILRVPALVVRTTQSGAGLMFLDANLATFRTLLAQLLAEKKPVAPSSRTMHEPVTQDTLQRLASTMVRSTHSTEAGVTESSTDGSRLDPRLPESGPN